MTNYTTLHTGPRIASDPEFEFQGVIFIPSFHYFQESSITISGCLV